MVLEEVEVVAGWGGRGFVGLVFLWEACFVFVMDLFCVLCDDGVKRDILFTLLTYIHIIYKLI